MVPTVVGDIGTILSIADVATRACLRIARFIDDMGDAGEKRSNLYTRVTTLGTLLDSVKSATSKRSEYIGTGSVSTDEDQILRKMHLTIGHCVSTMEKFEAKLASLGPSQKDPKWGQRAMLQLRFEVSGSGIARIERDIQADTETLQLLLTCLSP